jgi:uncharacterized protein YukE
MRLKKIQDIDSGITYASHEINHGDWPFRFLVRVQYCDDWDSEWARNGKYYCMIQAVSPVAAVEKINDAIRSIGMEREEFDGLTSDWQGLILAEYGTAATLWQSQGNNLRKLLREARHELKSIDFLFGFAMDKPQNMIGDTGWDWIKGDVCASLRRHKETV